MSAATDIVLEPATPNLARDWHATALSLGWPVHRLDRICALVGRGDHVTDVTANAIWIRRARGTVHCAVRDPGDPACWRLATFEEQQPRRFP